MECIVGSTVLPAKRELANAVVRTVFCRDWPFSLMTCSLNRVNGTNDFACTKAVGLGLAISAQAVFNLCSLQVAHECHGSAATDPLDSYQKSYQIASGCSDLCIRVEMAHSHADGWAPEEIYTFAEHAVVPAVLCSTFLQVT